jgi:orotate phosphoribosyltransferase
MNEKIAQALVEANVVKFGEFKLASGIISPIYINLRVLPSYPQSMETVTEELVEEVKKINPDVVAGAETAGIPLSTAISIKSKIPMIYVRKRPKGYGMDKLIEGELSKGQKVVLIDDMATNAFSKVRFVEGIRDAGGIIEHVLIVLDREQGGIEALGKENVELHSLITLRELLNYMKDNGKIGEKEFDEVLDYLDKNS